LLVETVNNKLVEGIKSLERSERSRFDAFLRSPYHNTRKLSLRCWEYLQQFAPTFCHTRLTVEALGQHLFPRKKVSRQAVLDEISHLYRLLKSFWELEALQTDPLLQRSLRLQQLSERGLDRLYAVERKAAQKLLENTNVESELYYQYELSWATIDNEHFGRQQQRTVDESLSQRLSALDVYYLILALRESCEALNRQHILNASYSIPLLPAMVELLADSTHPYRAIPFIDTYYHIFLTLQATATEQDYEALLDTLRRFRDRFSEQDRWAMYKYAQNFCIRKMNLGSPAYGQKLFALYQELLKEKILLFKGHLAHTDYKNIVTTGIRVKSLDWVETFMETYREHVVPEFRENVYAYCRASLEVENGNTQLAIRLLHQISHTDVHYQLSARQLLAKIYYQNDDLEGLLYTIQAYRHFLKRNREIPKSRRQAQLSFLTLLKSLALMRDRLPTYGQEKRKMTLLKYHARLQKADSLSNRSWLKEAFEGLRENTL
jgi:hypothetical protein